MVSIGALWLPILVSAVAVFIASSIFWMVVRHHESDWKGLPEEDAILDAFRKAGTRRGMYRFPYAPGKQMQGPEMKAKLAKGPSGFVFYFESWSGSMGKSLAIWFLYLLAVSAAVAFLTGHALAPGSPFSSVFEIAATAGVVAYASALIPTSIWWGRSWSVTAKDVFDAVVYGLLTAAMFGWLWPR